MPLTRLSPYHEVLQRAFVIASEHGRGCDPVHLLAALSELDGSIGAALTPTVGGDLMPRPGDAPVVTGGWASYMTMQTQDAAIQFADRRAEDPQPAHLLVAVIDQGDDEAMDMLTRAGIDPNIPRRVALAILAANPDHARIEIPPLTPAGTMDRPILDESQLDLTAWQTLMWRQAHLPIAALRNKRDWECLRRLEVDAAYRLCRRLDLEESQQLSLCEHHYRRVHKLAREACPEIVPPPESPQDYSGPFVSVGYAARGEDGRRLHWQPRFLQFTIRWGTWFKARWGLIARFRERTHAQVFAYRIRGSYTGIPEIPTPGE